MVERQVALLRGINVGGKHIVPMAALAEVFAGLGCRDVKTYIQSGNVVSTPPSRGLGAAVVAAAIEKRFGFAVPVVLRSASELAAIVEKNPFPRDEPKHLHVVFLAAPLIEVQLAALQALAVDGEQVAALGNEICLYLPAGSGNSKLATGCIAPKLPRTNTIRNWPTVLKLAAMLQA